MIFQRSRGFGVVEYGGVCGAARVHLLAYFAEGIAGAPGHLE